MKIAQTLHIKRLAQSCCYVLLCLVLALAPSKLAFADANQLFISPNSSQMNKGTSFTVNVKSYADTEEASGTAVGTVTYPASKLSVTSISIGGSAYGSPDISQGSGTIGFNASRTPAPSGIAQIFSIKFKAIKGGTAVVSFKNTSKVNGATTVYGNGVFTIIDNSPPPPSNSPSPSPSPTQSASPVPVTSKPDTTNENVTEEEEVQTETDETGLIDNNVAIEAYYDSASVSWNTTTKKSSNMKFTYGSDFEKLDKSASVKKDSNTSYSVKLSGLEPGLRYYFNITGKDAKGETGTYSSAVYTRGYPVVFTITENDLPAKYATVTLGNLSRNADQSGKLTIGLAAGDYQGTITTETASKKISLTVEEKEIPGGNSTPASQSFSYGLTSSVLDSGPGSGFSVLTFIGILVVGTLVLCVAFFIYISYRRRRFEMNDTVVSRGPSVVIDDGFNWSEQPSADISSTSPAQTKNTVSDGPVADSALNNPAPESPIHNNSVYINDAEPEDMFDRAKRNDYETAPSPPIQTATTNNGDIKTADTGSISEQPNMDSMDEGQTSRSSSTDTVPSNEIVISHDSTDESERNPN